MSLSVVALGLVQQLVFSTKQLVPVSLLLKTGSDNQVLLFLNVDQKKGYLGVANLASVCDFRHTAF